MQSKNSLQNAMRAVWHVTKSYLKATEFMDEYLKMGRGEQMQSQFRAKKTRLFRERRKFLVSTIDILSKTVGIPKIMQSTLTQ